mgnify:CR=1 FL=1
MRPRMYTVQEITLSQILAASAKIEGDHVVLITIRKQTQVRVKRHVRVLGRSQKAVYIRSNVDFNLSPRMQYCY